MHGKKPTDLDIEDYEDEDEYQDNEESDTLKVPV